MDYIECIPGKACGKLVVAGFTPTTVNLTKRARITVTRQEVSALVIGDAEAMRDHLCGPPLVDNILNDFKSVNFIQREKLRCMSRHWNLPVD